MFACERYEASVEIRVKDIERMARELGFSLEPGMAQEILTRIGPKLYNVALEAIEIFIKGFLLGENTRGKDSKGAGNSSGDSPAAERHVPEETDLQGPAKE